MYKYVYTYALMQLRAYVGEAKCYACSFGAAW